MTFAAKFAPRGGGNSGSIAAKIIKETALVWHLWLNNQPNGKRAWCIIDVPKAKYKEFKRLLDSGSVFHIPDYGTILYKGWDQPSAEIKAEMREKYGMYADESEG